MPETSDPGSEKPRRCVALRRDGDDFVVVFVPEDVVVFRNRDADALRRACACDGRSSAIRCRLGTTRLIPPKKRRAASRRSSTRGLAPWFRHRDTCAGGDFFGPYRVRDKTPYAPTVWLQGICKTIEFPENRRYQQHQYEPSFRNPKGFGDTVGKYFPEGQYEGEFGRFYASVRKGNSDCNIKSSASPFAR